MLLLSYRGNSIITFSKYSKCLNIFLLNIRKAKFVSFKNERRSIFFTRVSSRFVGTNVERFETFRDPGKFQELKLITLRLASPDTIRRWAETRLPNGKVVGLVHNANTLHHNTLKPLKGGLFCERIFGPTKDFQCACGIQKEKNFSRTLPTRLFCLKCDVEYTWSLKRRYQSGYIRLVSPVAHLWYVKETPSFIAVMLDMKRKTLDSVIYCSSTLTIDSSIAQLKNNFMYSKTDFPFSGFESLTQIESKKPQKYFKESNNDFKKVKSKTSNNGIYIPTFINEAENLPFYKNVLWLKTNRENTVLTKQNEIEKSNCFFVSKDKKNLQKLKSRSILSYRLTTLSEGQKFKELEVTKNWTNFWRLAYKIAKNKVKKQKTFGFENFKGGNSPVSTTEYASSLGLSKFVQFRETQVKRARKNSADFFLPTSLFTIALVPSSLQNINYFEGRYLPVANATQNLKNKEEKFFSRKSLNSKELLLVFYAQKTSKLFKKLPKFSRSLSFFFSEACFFFFSETVLLYNVKQGPKSPKKISKNRPTLRESSNLEKSVATKRVGNRKPYFTFRGFDDKNSQEKSDKLHLSITTFPVFLHIVMYLFQHCFL